MWEFIVSGYIPGTSVQVTFETWLYAIAALAGLSLLSMLSYKAVKYVATSWRTRKNRQTPVLVISPNHWLY